MKHLHATKLLIAASMLISTAFGQYSSKEMSGIIEKQFEFAARQLKVLETNVPDTMMPKTLNNKTGVVEVSKTNWWCSGFFPASLLYVYEHTNDKEILRIAQKRLDLQEPMKHYTGNHDLGFMMFNPFGHAYRLFKRPNDKTTIDTAAMSLITRYRPSIKSIQSWNKNKNFNCPVIIDNMMNLELLMWVSQNGGDPKFREIAINHANSTIANHYRSDYSAFHVLDYDLETGKLIAGKNHQGYKDASAWSRGQAWGFYGFVMMYRFTKDQHYLDHARNIAKFLFNHPNMPKDYIMYWDFNTPDIPNTLRDASASAILASGLLELAQFTKGSESSDYINKSASIIKTLSTPAYCAAVGENGGFLLKHSVGHLPANSEVDVPLTYADYYYLEALHRFKNWVLKN
ncbi:glucuronyl hydrolase [Bacteroidota bacterium]|nr:glucuronyl hydrolase [Bacteroidota bacterium]